MSSFLILTCCRAPTPWAARGLKRAEPTSTRAPGRPKTSFTSLPSEGPHAVRVSGNRTRIFRSKVQPATSAPPRRCNVAVCNNYAIFNKLQTALNCNAVCNTSYFKLRCDGNAICNVLQIASKFYHLKILKRRKKLINGKMHRFNHILL